MGSWSTKPFGNDTACGWVIALEKSDDSSFINEAIDKLDQIKGEIDSPECEEFIAACAVVASSSTEPIRGVPIEIKQWVREKGYSPDFKTIKKASSGLKRIIKSSELLCLWQEAENDKSWIKSVDFLIESLDVINPENIPQRVPKPRPIPRSLDKLCEHPDLQTNPKIRERIQKKLKSLSNVNELVSTGIGAHSPLTLMCKHELYEEIDILLEMGADVNETKSGSPYRALAYVCLYNNHELINRLIDLGAKVNEDVWKTLTDSGEPEKLKISRVFLGAVAKADIETIDILIKNNLDVFVKDLNGETALHKAAEAGNLEATKYLVELGLDVNALTDNFSHTPLTKAVHKKYLAISEYLIQSGADVNICDVLEFRGEKRVTSILDSLADEEDSDLYRLLERNGAKKGSDF